MRTTTRLAAAAALLLLLGALGAAAGSGASARRAQRVARPLGILRVPGVATRRASGGDGTPMTYHGGRVLHESTTYPVFWSPPGYPMPDDYQATISKYFQDVAAASASTATSYSVMTQYFDDQGQITTHSTFGGAIVLTDPPPANQCHVAPRVETDAPITLCVIQSTLVSLIDHAAASRGIAPGGSNIFFIFTPPGVASCSNDGGSCSYSEYAAYHSVTPSGQLYAVHPSFTPARLEGITHEHIEIITDPEGGGWWSDGPSNGEIADLCQDDAQTDQVLGTTTYTLSTEWSNADGTCSSKAPPPTSRLTLDTTGEGDGQISAFFSGQKLSCKTARGDSSCRTVVRRGATITLKASPEIGFSFGGWDAAAPCKAKKTASCSFTIGSAGSHATASFLSGALDKFLVSVDVTGKGSVVWPDGKRCRTSCIKAFASGTAVALRAVPAKGWKLAKFADDTRSCKSKARCTIRLRDNDDVFVAFVRA